MAHFEGKPDRNDMYWDIIQERQDFDAWAGALGHRVPPGTDFNYIATDTHVLSAVLRGVYGQPFTEIVQDRLWQRGGFGGDATWGLDGSGHAMRHCCLSLRLEEFAHLGQLYVEDLVFEGEQTVRDDWFAMVAQFSTGQPMLFAEGENGAGPAECATATRTLASRETFQ